MFRVEGYKTQPRTLQPSWVPVLFFDSEEALLLVPVLTVSRSSDCCWFLANVPLIRSADFLLTDIWRLVWGRRNSSPIEPTYHGRNLPIVGGHSIYICHIWQFSCNEAVYCVIITELSSTYLLCNSLKLVSVVVVNSFGRVRPRLTWRGIPSTIWAHSALK
jgi:hypothetical protein